MKRTFVLSDWLYRLSHTVRRNRFAVLLYTLLCLLFLVVGIAVGVNISDKTAFVLNNSAVIFKFLRGDIGIFAFFFIDTLLMCVYCLFAASMFFNRIVTFLSLTPCAYMSYVLGLNVSIIVVVYSVSALPMLFVLFVPICILEIGILCFISFGCFGFYSMNGSCMPSKIDIAQYYKGIIKFLIIVVALEIIKTFTLGLFGSALIGIVC